MSNERILICDNDQKFLELCEDQLRKLGYWVTVAHNSIESREYIKRYKPDLVILDVRLDDDDDPQNTSGISIANNPEFKATLKIITTKHPNLLSLLDQLNSNKQNSEKLTTIDKRLNIDKLIEAVEFMLKTFSTNKRQNLRDEKPELRGICIEVVNPTNSPIIISSGNGSSTAQFIQSPIDDFLHNLDLFRNKLDTLDLSIDEKEKSASVIRQIEKETRKEPHDQSLIKRLLGSFPDTLKSLPELIKLTTSAVELFSKFNSNNNNIPL